MTTAALSPSKTYIEDGTTLNFAVPFRYLSASSLQVDRIAANGTVTRLQRGVDYTATAGNTDAGGTLTLLNTTAGAKLRIRRATARSQTTNYATADTFPAKSHETALDRAMLIDQEQDVQIADTAARALLVPDGETIGVLASRAARALKGAAFDSNGDLIPVVTNPAVPLAEYALRNDMAVVPAELIGAVPRDANTNTGGGTSGAAALQAMAEDGAREVRLRAYYTGDQSTGATLIDGAVTIPVTQRWRGAGFRTKLVFSPADPLPAGYILLGVNEAYQADQTYNLYPNKTFGDVYLDGRAAAAAAKNPVGIVVGGPAWRVHDIYAFGMQTVVRGADVGGTGGVDPHADHLRISNVHLNNQPNPVDFDPANPGNARYGIDWLRTNAGADGAEIERCQSNVMGALNSGTAKRARFIGFRSFTNAKVRAIINGDVFFYQSNGVVEDCYFESGVVSNMQSDMVVRSTHFWMRSEVTCGADVGAVPVQFLVTPAGVAAASQAPSSLTLSHCVFNYDAAGSGSVAGNVTGLGGYTLTNPNFSIGSGIYGTMTVENCWRAGPYSNGRGWYQRYGINCGMAEFDNYSHFASVSSRFVGSASGGSRWHIEASRGAIVITSNTSCNGLESASFDTVFSGPFKGATATYYYRVAIYLDKIRGIGILGGLEVSQAATGGATGAISLRLGFDIAGGGFIARVYRGTSPNTYDRYVDVPVIEAGRLFDSGVDIGGYPWINRTAGAADPVNANISAGIEIKPGERTATSDAYGQAIVRSTATTMPTLGGWRRGDEVRYPTGRWQRLTDCTSAAPAHVVNVDWKRIIYPAAAAVTAPTGGATIDTQARTAINDLIARLQTQGIIS